MASMEFFMYVMYVYIMCMYESMYVCIYVCMYVWPTSYFLSYPISLMNTENILLDDQRL